MLETDMQDPAAAAAGSSEEPELARGMSSSTMLSKCNCLMPKRITARSSSSESLDGTRRSSAKEGPAASVQRFLYNVYHKIQSGGGHGPGGLGTYTGVLIPTCENMWGKYNLFSHSWCYKNPSAHDNYGSSPSARNILRHIDLWEFQSTHVALFPALLNVLQIGCATILIR